MRHVNTSKIENLGDDCMKTSCDGERVVKTHHTYAINQIKLAVAMELKSEGYSTVVFDKPIEVYGRRVSVHVYCEDELGLRMAVYCINKPSQVKPNEILDIVDLIRRGVEDCDVALAFPLAMLPKAKILIGLTSRVYMLDEDGRVWVHNLWRAIRREAVLLTPNLVDRQVIEDPKIRIHETSQMRLHYIV